MLKKVSCEDFIDPTYRTLMRSKRGRKLVSILRLLSEGMMTIKEITRRTRFSRSEVRDLIGKGLKDGYVEICNIERVHRKRGKPVIGEFEKDTGRPPDYYYLTGDGKWLIRLDPEVRDRWDEVKIAYKKIVEHTDFDSYADLVYAIRKHPQLKKYQKPYYFMDEELELTIFSPFIYGNEHGAKEIQLYDELVKTIETAVKPEHVLNYYLALERSLVEFNAILDRCKSLVEKMQKIQGAKEYLGRRSKL